MLHTFVFCSERPEYKNNQIRSSAVYLRHPGAGWVTEFANLVEASGHSFFTSDIARERIQSGNLHPASILIISEENSRDAVELQRLGAVPLVVFCLESPLFAGKFYETIRSAAAPYSVRMFFQGAIDDFFPSGDRCWPVRFPAVFKRDLARVFIPWSERKFMVMVAGNKYWRTSFSWRFLWRAKHLEAWLRGKLGVTSSSVKRLARTNQLHDSRLALIEFFGSRGLLDLFGAGWQESGRLPHRWMCLRRILTQLKPEMCDDKLQTMRGYRFALCLENIAYPGYVTEKIIDCLAAGVIPIYLGAPDVAEFIPSECFIDLRRFHSYEDLEHELRGIDENKAQACIRAGSEFLFSARAQEITHEGFAEKLWERIQPFISK